jgi:Fic family protein
MTDEVIKSSAIEGETLDARQVRSSLARRLGIDIGGGVQSPRAVGGIVEMMLDATRNFAQGLLAKNKGGGRSVSYRVAE